MIPENILHEINAASTIRINHKTYYRGIAHDGSLTLDDEDGYILTIIEIEKVIANIIYAKVLCRMLATQGTVPMNVRIELFDLTPHIIPE